MFEKFSSFDIETSPFSMFTPELNFVGLYNESTILFLERSEEFIRYCFPKFVKESYLHTIVAFNIQFDYNILFEEYFSKHADLPNGWQPTAININGKAPFFAVFEIKEKYQVVTTRKKKTTKTYVNRVVFLDVGNFFGGIHYKLEFLMKIFTPDLLYGKKTGDFGIIRNETDIIATLRIFKHFYKTYEKYQTLFPYYSISAISFRELLDISEYKWLQDKECSRLDWLVKIERQSYKGGIVYPNPKFLLQIISGVAYFDINSLYPFIMRNLKVPYALIGRFNLLLTNFEQCKKTIESFYNSKDTFTLLLVKIELYYPLIPTKKDNKLQLLANEEFTDWICENELYPALQRTDNPFKTLEIQQIIQYKAQEKMFASFVDKHAQEKEKADLTMHQYEHTFKKEIQAYWNNELSSLDSIMSSEQQQQYFSALVDRMQAKLKMNTSYGKFGQIMTLTRQFVKEDKEYTILLENQPDFFFDELNNQMLRMRYEHGFIFGELDIPDAEKFGAVTIVASAITAGARGYIMSFYKPEETIYIDTDSITTKKESFPYPDQINSKLGGWKIEKEGSIQVFGKKWYKFEDKLKVKGIPAKALQLDDTTFTFYRLCRFRESQVRKLPLFSSLLVTKQLDATKKTIRTYSRTNEELRAQLNNLQIFNKRI